MHSIRKHGMLVHTAKDLGMNCGNVMCLNSPKSCLREVKTKCFVEDCEYYSMDGWWCQFMIYFLIH